MGANTMVGGMVGSAQESVRKRCERKLAQMRNERQSFESHWMELAQNFTPRRGRWTLGWANAPGTSNRGDKRHQQIVNETPIFAARTLASGLMSGLTSPSRPWFRLTTPDPQLAEVAPVKQWLYVVEQRMRQLFARSNLYNALPILYSELGVFGTACMVALDDEEEVLRFYPLTAGTYWISQSNRQIVDSLYREFSMTVRQMAQEFGIEACSQRVQALHRNGEKETWISVCHAIEPNDEADYGHADAKGMAWRSCYWEKGGANSGEGDRMLAERGFDALPMMCPRWELAGEDIYGSSPAMHALGTAKQLQLQERRKAQAIDKLVEPPLTAPTSLRNSVIRMVAGGVTYHDSQQNQDGVRPLYEVRPDLSGMLSDIQACEQRINTALFSDLFLAISQMEGIQPRNQFEIQERKEEKLLMLGPVLERLNDELLDPLIERAFSAMVARSMPVWEGKLVGNPYIPPPPKELAGVDLKVEYISILAQAQKTLGISSIERLVTFTGSLAQASMDPSVWDNLNKDQMMAGYAEMLGVSPLDLNDAGTVQAQRQQRAQQAAQQQAIEAANKLAPVAGAVKSLSDSGVHPDSVLSRLGSVLQGQQGQQGQPGGQAGGGR